MLFLANQSNENISQATPFSLFSLMDRSLWSLGHQSSGASEGP